MESAFYHKVKKYIEADGGYVFKIHGGMMQKSGIPDVYVCWRGIHVWIELKCCGRKVSDRQRLVMRKMINKKVCCLVLREKDGVYIETNEREILFGPALLPDALNRLVEIAEVFYNDRI